MADDEKERLKRELRQPAEIASVKKKLAQLDTDFGLGKALDPFRELPKATNAFKGLPQAKNALTGFVSKTHPAEPLPASSPTKKRSVSEHYRSRLKKQVAAFSWETWLKHNRGISRTSAMDYQAGRLTGKVSAAKQAQIEKAIDSYDGRKK